MPKPKFSAGPQPTDMMLIGESPGREESLGRPFANTTGAGGVLDSCLKAVGLKRSQIRITNVIHRKYAKEFNEQDVSELLEEIEFTQPKVIVSLGNIPLNALLNKKEILRHRGSVYSIQVNPEMKVHVIPAIHPAAVLHVWKWKALLEFDLQRAAEVLYNGYTKPEYKFYTCPPTSNLDFARQKIYEAGSITTDIETIHNTYITCIGMSWSETESICIRLDAVAAFRFVEEILSDPTIEKEFHFGCYDRYHLKLYGFDLKGKIFDTINAHHVLWSELPHGLDFLCSTYTAQPYYKDYMKSWTEEPHWSRLSEYNNTDCVVTRKSANELRKEMVEEGLTDVYERLYPKLADVTLKMSMKGILIDKDKRDARIEDFREKIDTAQIMLNEVVGTELNAKSPKGVKEALREEGFNVQDTAKPTLMGIRAKSSVARLVLAVREGRDVISRYLDMKLDADGRCRCTYSLSAAKTGRLGSSGNPCGTGTNLQNIPTWLRDMFIADDEDHVFIISDFSQIEPRIVAKIAHEENMLAIFASGGDVYRKAASMMLGKMENLIVYAERRLCKGTSLGSNYGMGPYKLAEILGVSRSEGKRLIALYHAAFPMIRSWHLDVQHRLRENAVLTNVFGRRRVFFERWGDTLFREGYAQEPQSTASDWTNMCLVELDRLGVDVRLQVHDCIVSHVHRSKAQETVAIVRDVMERKIPGLDLCIPCDIAISNSWKEDTEETEEVIS